MNARPTIHFLAGCLLLSLSAAVTAQSPRPDAKIKVFVYNYAGVAPATLARSERIVAQIYAHAGIETKFFDCPLTPDQVDQFPACQIPNAPSALVMRVLSRFMSERAGLTQAKFGSALLPLDGKPGVIAQVCAPCSEMLAKGSEPKYAMVLGHTMAHELGHLLLGIDSHSATGLMHANWHHKELEDAARGVLLFTSWEADKIRRNAAARLAAPVITQAAAK